MKNMASLDINLITEIVGRWAQDQFKQATNQSIINHLKREVKELEDNPNSTEVADCVLLLMHLAHRNGWNLGEAVQTKFLINIQRQWGPVDSEGVSEHVS